jgi:hypothetical protein
LIALIILENGKRCAKFLRSASQCSGGQFACSIIASSFGHARRYLKF